MRDDPSSAAGPVMISVEVAYAEPQEQFLERLQLPAGRTVADAIEASGVSREFPDIDVDPDRIGIFSRKVSLNQVLEDGDRVEIYRPLQADPKEVRRAKAAADAEKAE